MEGSVLIFGGGRGIGRAIAKQLIAKYSQVSIASRNIRSLKELIEEMKDNKSRINAITADIGDENQVLNAFESHKTVFGVPPSAVINTAAIQGPIGQSWTLSPEEWSHTLRTNLFGSFLVTKSAIEYMIPRGFGSIIHFSGGGAAYARPNFSAYGVSKTGLLRLIETVSEELKSAGYPKIIINAIAPGAVKTDMTNEIMQHADRAGEKERKEAEKVLQSGGTSADLIISLIEFLCNPDLNKGISGRLIHVREDYAGFVSKFDGNFPEEAGKLRRVPLI